MGFVTMFSGSGRPARHLSKPGYWMLFLCILLFAGACSPESTPGQAVQGDVDYKGAGAGRIGENKEIDGIIVAVGDSLTAGQGVDEALAYPARLEKKLEADGHHWRVINAGVSGETSSGALARIEWIISALDPDVVILETGANDGLRGIDPHTLQNNLEKLIRILKGHDITVILAGMRMLPNLGPEYVQAFGRIYPQVAQEHDVILIPFFLQGVAGEIALNQSDRIHPTAEGYARIVEYIYPYVLQAVRKHSSGPTG